MERLTKLCLKDLYILREFTQKNYNELDKQLILENLEIAIQKVAEIRNENARNNNVEVSLDWI